MDLSLSQEQLAVRSVFADFFAKEATLRKVRAAEPLGYDGELWEKLAAIGATAMGLPDEVGGGGAGALDLALVAEEAGRRIAPVPFVESTVAGRLLCSTREPPGLPRPFASGFSSSGQISSPPR